MHVAINICLFPPVFFFAALYYTDIASLLFVLLSYHASLLVSGETGHSWGLVVLQIFYAVLALLFRQTNVFWVGVFPIGLVAIQLLQRDQHHTAWFSLGVSIDGQY
jgi:alpha-1,2-glucosyltransferase